MRGTPRTMTTAQPGFDAEAVATYMMTIGVQAAINVALAALILIVGFIVAGAAARTVRKLSERHPRIDRTLAGFFSSLVKYAVIAVVVIAVLARFGVETTSLVAAFGAVTLAIGFALQGTLSNLAAGVMIVFFRPYKIGDFVEIAGAVGSVKNVTLFYTELNTVDNKQIIVPNGQAWGDVITNYSAYPTRRADFVFSISYDDDIDQAQAVIRQVFEADERVLKDPALFVEVSGHGASSVDITVRAWVKSDDLWPVHFHMLKAVKKAFDANNIEIPFPHVVEIKKDAS